MPTKPDFAVKLRQINRYSITTSGYDDRWLKVSTHWVAEYTNDQGRSYTPCFNYRQEVSAWLHACGMESEQGVEMLLNAERENRIGGDIPNSAVGGRVRYLALPLSPNDIAGIEAFLRLRQGATGKYNPECIARDQEQLEKHPLTGDLAAIVDSQLAECDRKNTVAWGHPNGRAVMSEGTPA